MYALMAEIRLFDDMVIELEFWTDTMAGLSAKAVG